MISYVISASRRGLYKDLREKTWVYMGDALMPLYC